MSTAILPQVINLYTKRHATKANGFALCGSSATGIILPFLTVTLLNNYGMSGAFLNLSAVMLNCIPGVILLRNTTSGRVLKKSSCEKENLKKDSSSEYETVKEIASVSSEINLKTSSSGFQNSAHCMHIHKKDTLVKDPACFEQLSIATDGDEVKKQINDIDFEINASQKLNIYTFDNDYKDSRSKIPLDLLSAKNSFGCLEIFSTSHGNCKDNVYSVDDAKSTDTKEASLIKNNASSKINNKYSEQSQEHCQIRKNQNSTNIFSVYWDPLFFAFALPRCLSSMLYVIVPTVLVDFCIDKGISKKQSTYEILMTYSFADLFGKLCLGWITDGNHMSRIRYIVLWYCIIAFSTGMMAWSNGFAVMTISVIFQAMGQHYLGLFLSISKKRSNLWSWLLKKYS